MRAQRAWIAMVVLAACSSERSAPPSGDQRSAPPSDQKAWWCWPNSVCFARHEQCQRASTETGVGATCVSRSVAYCRSGCFTPEPGGRPSCGPMCAIDAEACGMFDNLAGRCVETSPRPHPELAREFVEPGWWCWSLTGPTGRVASECVKHKPQCDHDLADTIKKLGLDSGAATCTRATATPICFSWSIDDDLTFVCTLTQDACEGAREVALGAPPVPDGHTRTAPSPCGPYPYD